MLQWAIQTWIVHELEGMLEPGKNYVYDLDNTLPCDYSFV